MSCGCGGGKLPARVQLRMEAVRLAGMAQTGLTPAEVYAFITDGVDLDDLDSPPVPLAVGDGAEAVTSRNALINSPLSRIFGLPPKVAAKLQVAGISALGMLVQVSGAELLERGMDVGELKRLQDDLARYGLTLPMNRDQLHEWIMKGAH